MRFVDCPPTPLRLLFDSTGAAACPRAGGCLLSRLVEFNTRGAAQATHASWRVGRRSDLLQRWCHQGGSKRVRQPEALRRSAQRGQMGEQRSLSESELRKPIGILIRTGYI